MVKGTWGSTVQLHHRGVRHIYNAREATPAHGQFFDFGNFYFTSVMVPVLTCWPEPDASVSVI